MVNRWDVLREAADVVFKVGDDHRNGEYGDESTMREVRDGIYTAAEILNEMADAAEGVAEANA